MNERIKEIARECKIDVDMHPGGFPNEQALVVQDFADAIISECLSVIAKEESLVGSDWRCSDGVHISYKIADHFGVEL